MFKIKKNIGFLKKVWLHEHIENKLGQMDVYRCVTSHLVSLPTIQMVSVLFSPEDKMSTDTKKNFKFQFIW